MNHKTADRLNQLPPYIFVELDKMKTAAIERGEDVISLSIGDPDQPTPQPIVDALAQAARHAVNHQYPIGVGLKAFREEVAKYYERVHGVAVDPAREVLTLIGSKEGIAHFSLAFTNPGDVALVPEPAYPVYSSSTLFAGGIPVVMPLRRENGFLPDLDAVPPDTYARTRVMFLNYPNNPTAALATPEFFERVISLAKKHGFVVLHDAAYLDMTYGGAKALSFLAMPGARDIGIELHSLSKTFNMTGWRIGFAAGNPDLVHGLAAIKSNLDSGVFTAIQHAGVTALRAYDKIVAEMLRLSEERLAALSQGIRDLGWTDFVPPKATFYVWLATRGGRTSMDMTMELLKKCAVAVTPGTAFGASGEGYFRIALTTSAERIREACRRMKLAGF